MMKNSLHIAFVMAALLPLSGIAQQEDRDDFWASQKAMVQRGAFADDLKTIDNSGMEYATDSGLSYRAGANARDLVPEVRDDIPSDAYSTNGNRGQYTVVVPSHELVIVRRGLYYGRQGFSQWELIREVLKAVKN